MQEAKELIGLAWIMQSYAILGIRSWRSSSRDEFFLDTDSQNPPLAGDGKLPVAPALMTTDPEKKAGRPRGEQIALRKRMKERLLEGALNAVAARGIGKLTMGDVSEFAGVSRGTTYRYFSNVEAVLIALGRREAELFEQRVWDELGEAPGPGGDRLGRVLDLIDRLARDHPLIRRLPETDPGFALVSLRERFPDIRETFQRLLVPQLQGTEVVTKLGVEPEQIANWAARMMISMFLIPESDPPDTTDSLRSAYRALAGEGADPQDPEDSGAEEEPSTS